MSKLYCIDCKKTTKHIPKLSAVMAGNLVCDKCHRMNGFCTLLKPDVPSFSKTSSNVCWIEWGEDSKFKARHEDPQIGYSLLMSPFNECFTWQTTPVVEIIEQDGEKIHFKTENSEYVLYINKKTIAKYSVEK